MAQAMSGSFTWLLLFVVGFYAGELVWRERAGKISEVVDAFPTPDWIPLLSKVVALAAVIVLFLAAGSLFCMGYQLLRGYHHLQPAVPAIHRPGPARFPAARHPRRGAAGVVQQQVRGLRAVAGLHRFQHRAVATTPLRPPVPLRQRAGHAVFGHERFRLVLDRHIVVPRLLGLPRGRVARARCAVLAARQRRRLA